MKFVLAAVGRMKAGPERDLCDRYIERAKGAARSASLTGVDLREIDESRARRPEDRKADEAKALLALLPDNSRLVVLDERGRTLTSPDFANDIARARDGGVPAYVLVLGGPDGLSEELRGKADRMLAFGAMTWPHRLARIMAAEQIYRATTILAGHPYHRV